MTEVLWEGEHEGVKTRIVRTASDMEDCVVEQFKRGENSGPEWTAADDDVVCSNVYMGAYLESRKALEKLYDRDMGNLRLKDGLDALEGVGRILRRDA